jgi:hypothetical protein
LGHHPGASTQRRNGMINDRINGEPGAVAQDIVVNDG